MEISLHKAKGISLGLDVAHGDGCGKFLLIKHVKPDGAIEAWNRRCLAERGEMLEMAIQAGDRIASVNNVAYNAERMLQECAEKEHLKLMVLRSGNSGSGGDCVGEVPCQEDPVVAEAVPERRAHGAHRKAAKAAALVVAEMARPAVCRNSVTGRVLLPAPAPAQAAKAAVKAIAKAAAAAVDKTLVAQTSAPPAPVASQGRKRAGRRGGGGGAKI